MPKSDPPLIPATNDPGLQDLTHDLLLVDDPVITGIPGPPDPSPEFMASIEAILMDPQGMGLLFSPDFFLPTPPSPGFSPPLPGYSPPSPGFSPTPPSPGFLPTPPSPSLLPTPPSPGFSSIPLSPTPLSPGVSLVPLLAVPPMPVLSPTPATTSTDIIMGCKEFTTGLRLKRTHLKKRVFDPNASDSESEAEEPDRKVQKKGNKYPTLLRDSVGNQTKRDGQKTVKGRKVTKRDETGKRLVPRVDNWIPSQDDWPNLAADANAIHDLIPKKLWNEKKQELVTNQSFGATTIVCTVFETDEGYRKYAFSNLEGPMPPYLRTEAERRGYHVIKAMQSHAEGEMIQYAHIYKHRNIFSMGCDKEHCAECAFLMRSYLGNYHTQTATSDAVFPNYHMPEPLVDATKIPVRPSTLPGWTPGMMPTPAPAPLTLTPTPTITPSPAPAPAPLTLTPAPTPAPTPLTLAPAPVISTKPPTNGSS